MPAALPLTGRISQGSSRSVVNRVLTSQFGDGYSQSLPDGINNQVEKWSVSYDSLLLSERATLLAVLDAVGSWDYVTWQPFGSATSKKFKVTKEGYSEMPVSGDMYSISFQLEQVY